MSGKRITGSTLKIIAMISMFIDHVAAAVLVRMIRAANYTEFELLHANVYDIYTTCRMIGRIAFPIFCFLLVEGFLHTGNKKKYAVRLALFALASEIPFDLAFQSELISFSYQNVGFTLFFGFVGMLLLEYIEKDENLNRIIRCLLQIMAAACVMGVAELLQTDYGAMGVLAILLFYILRSNRFYQIGAGCVVFYSEMAAWFAFLPIMIYNGKRGWKIKWALYIFYPLHLLILFAVCCIMGYAGYSAI